MGNYRGFFLLRGDAAMSGVEIRVRADARQATSELGKLERSLQNIETKVGNTTRAFQKLAIGITAAFTGGALTKGIVRSADAMTNLQNKVNLVTKDVKKTNVVMKELFDVAARSRSGIESTALTFNKFGLALKDSNKPLSELLIVTEAVNKAAVLSGAGAETAKASIIQLGQGLAAGTLRGEELNSVLEGMPRLAEAIADGMGIPFGTLKQAAEDGLLTAEAVYAAILDGATDIEAEFLTLNATVSGLATVFGNEWTRAIANLDDAVGISAAIKDKIMLATNAVRYFGQNIQLWAAIASSRLLILKLDIKYFAQDVMKFFREMFTEGFDTDAFAENLMAGLDSVRERVKGAGSIVIAFSVEKLDLIKEMLPSLDAVITSLTNFKNNVIGIFYDIWKRVVGDSLWTGIWDPAHKEAGQSLAVGESLSKYLDVPLKQLKAWGASIVTFFRDLHTGATESWSALVKEVNENGLQPTISSKLDSSWNIVTSSIESTWKLTTGKLISGWDEFAFYVRKNSGDGTGAGRIDIPFFYQIKEAFDKIVSGASDEWNAFVLLVKQTPVVVGAIAIGNSIRDNLEAVKSDIVGFFEENADAMAALISGALGAALNTSIRKIVIKGALVGAFSAAANILGNDPAFLQSVRTAARGWGSALRSALSGDGDLVADVLAGILNLAKAIGEGFIDGMFPEATETYFRDGLATMTALALGSFILLPTATAALAGIGVSMAAAMIGPEFITKMKTLLLAALTSPIIIAAAAIGAVVFIATSKSELAEQIRKLIADTVDMIINLPINLITGSTGSVQSRASDSINSNTATGSSESAYESALFVSSTNAIFKDMTEDQVRDAKDLWQRELNDLQMGGYFERLFNSPKINAFEEAIGKATEKLKRLYESKVSTGTPLNSGDKDLLPTYRATGGSISGPGSSTSDSIPAMLSDGEYVMQASAVRKFGPDFMARINAGIAPVFRATGGAAGTIAALTAQRAQAVTRGEFGDIGELNAKLAQLLELTSEQTAILDEGGAGAEAVIADAEGKKKEGKKEKEEKTTKEIAEDYAAGVQSDFQSAFSNLLSTGDIKGFFGSLADSFTMTVIDSFSESFTKSLFEGLTGEGGFLTNVFEGMFNFGSKVGEKTQKGVLEAVSKGGEGAAGGGGFMSQITGIFGGLFESISGALSGIFGGGAGGGGGGLFSGIMGLFSAAPGMSQGGTVLSTSTSQAGKDSVPAMLMPGEVVLSKNALSNMNNNSSAQQQSTFNINVSGDVSRQTRKEIVKMLPQIASGVNSQNKENNYRGR
jgi:tape measure domain-containing protein